MGPRFGWLGVGVCQVDMEEFRAAFERFGELCSTRHYGVPPINPKPASSSAFVNFCRHTPLRTRARTRVEFCSIETFLHFF